MMWHISDYAGRRAVESIEFQGKDLSFCKKLYHWIRWGKMLIRHEELLWFSGCEKDELSKDDISISALKDLFEKHIDCGLEQRVLEAQEFIEKYDFRWHYAKNKGLSKRQLDMVSDETINEFFNDSI